MIVDKIIWLFIKQYKLFILSFKFQMLSFDIINIDIITLKSQIEEFVQHDLIYYTIKTYI
jgi:hypothetical protein